MKWMLSVIALAFLAAPSAFAQEAPNHVELGVFAHYFRFTPTNSNFAGVGGRFGLNVTRDLQLEAEVSYDFNRVFTESFSNTSGAFFYSRSDIRVLHGLFGPKLQTGSGPVRLFGTLKGGFINFSFSPAPGVAPGFTSSVESLRDNNVSGVFYPGGGAEAFFGPVGLRLDVGDEIYFNSGAHNNLVIAFGPTIRF
jgi:hypothetical protein